jgi:hypothetical protein
MTFTVADPPALPLADPAKAVKPTPKPAPETAERQQVGARVTVSVYRELKARAALSGETVQTLVERAIVEFLAKS